MCAGENGSNGEPDPPGDWRQRLAAAVILAVVIIATLWVTKSTEAVALTVAPMLPAAWAATWA